MDESFQVIFGTTHLHPFDVDAPTLTTADGVVYVPIRWLCELFGLAPSHWIGAMCADYRKDKGPKETIEPIQQLPYQRPDGAIRAEWCLEMSRVIRWFSFRLQTRYVPAGVRREQLEAFREEVIARAEGIYEDRQTRFHETKRSLIKQLQGTAQTLETLDKLDGMLGPHIEHSAPTPAEVQANRAAFAVVLTEGRRLQVALADALRAALQKMLDAPVVDAVEVDDDGVVVDTVAMPIIPFVPDLSEVERCASAAQTWWTRDLVDWARAHGFSASFTVTEIPSNHTDHTTDAEE